METIETRRTQRVVPMQEVRCISPDGRIVFTIGSNPERLTYTVLMNNKVVVGPAQLDMRVDGYHLSSGVIFNGVESYAINETYPWHGAHSLAINHCCGIKIAYTHDLSMIDYILEVRAFNDGVAYRHIIPGSDAARRPDEYSNFILPQGSTVWYHDLNGHYEGEYKEALLEQIPAGSWAGPPVTFKLPDGAGYGSIMEANLVNYSGMALECDGRGGWVIGLGHRHPINYPFELRYGRLEAKRLAAPAVVTGTIVTPWRVIVAVENLNDLVNSDILPNLCPPADPQLFPQGHSTTWVQPGIAVWDYLDRNYTPRNETSAIERMKNFSYMGSQFGAKYHILESFAYKWSDAEIKEFIEYSNRLGVRALFWRHSKELRTPEQREEFFARLHRLGVAGAKIDFFDHEAKELIDLYEDLTRLAAKYQCIVVFHGSNKPTGRYRTWPNMMLHEGVKGMESRALEKRARHETILPFARYLAGPCDYTTMIFNERRRDTSWSHQIACLATFHSPILTIAAHPQSVLDNPALDVIKSIKPVWDETIVMPGSEIGRLTIFARRSGTMWILAVMSAEQAKTIQVPLAFLGAGEYQAKLVFDDPTDSGAVQVTDTTVQSSDILTIPMLAGGGFIGRFTR